MILNGLVYMEILEILILLKDMHFQSENLEHQKIQLQILCINMGDN
jgi:hypothetical protein